MKGRKTIFCGDIGCYTLGNAMPLDMVDTCLCMGAGLGIAQGIGHIEPDTSCFAFVGDSTFFASAITGVINAVYNQANMTLIILDNSLDHKAAVSCVKCTADLPGVKAIIFKSPCIAIDKPEAPLFVEEESCISCKKCIRELGCPALVIQNNKVTIDASLCTGCTLCAQL